MKIDSQFDGSADEIKREIEMGYDGSDDVVDGGESDIAASQTIWCGP